MFEHEHSLVRLFLDTLQIRRDLAVAISDGGSAIHVDLDVEPYDFLEQAEQDFARGGSGDAFNVVSNSRRAIRCEIDKVLAAFGFDTSHMKISEKLGLVKSIGFVAPRILQKVDSPRNLLEHVYRRPTAEEVEDSVDLATLFVEACERGLHAFQTEFSVGNEDDWVGRGSGQAFRKQLSVWFRTPDHHFDLNAEADTDADDRGFLGSVKILPKDPIFPWLVRTAQCASKFRLNKSRLAIHQIFDSLGMP